MPTFRADDGVDVRYVDRPADPGTCRPVDGRTPVVLHHGFGASAEIDWIEPGTVAALTAAGRRVVALDARGHGRSARPHDPARYGEARLADDVRLLLDVLGVPRCDLVGYSMGAVVSLRVAAREPRVRRLVVGGIGAGAVEVGGLDVRVLPPAVLREAMLADDPSAVADPGAAGFRAFAEATGADRQALAAVLAALPAEPTPVPLPLAAVRAPTLVIAGRDDPLAQRPEVLTAALPTAMLHLVDGDHGAPLRDPAFQAALVSFLAV